jgi:hypothetical protein
LNQDGISLLIHAARRGDLSIFEYLVAHGATIPVAVEVDGSDDTTMIAAMLQRRRDWIDQAAALAHQWHVPLTAIRVIHGYVVGFNWSAVYEALTKDVAATSQARVQV